MYALPVGEASHQLLRTVRRRKEFRRQGDAHAAFQATQQAYPARAGGSGEAGSPIRSTSWRWSMKGNAEGEPKSSDAGCGPEDGGLSAGRGSPSNGTLCLQKSAAGQRLKNRAKKRKTSGLHSAQAARSRS